LFWLARVAGFDLGWLAVVGGEVWSDWLPMDGTICPTGLVRRGSECGWAALVWCDRCAV
jgi:hypothetical protein